MSSVYVGSTNLFGAVLAWVPLLRTAHSFRIISTKSCRCDIAPEATFIPAVDVPLLANISARRAFELEMISM